MITTKEQIVINQAKEILSREFMREAVLTSSSVAENMKAFLSTAEIEAAKETRKLADFYLTRLR